jgi:LemA protein
VTAALLVILGAMVAVGLAFGGVYNRLVTVRNRYRNGYSQIDVQLKRRYDLIPNLLATAKGYLAHEKETLEALAKARSEAAAANARAAQAPGDLAAMGAIVGAENALLGTLGRFVGIVEKYPDLKGDKAMGQLMEELSTTENRIAFARQHYNDAVMEYNTARESFPAVLIAGSMGFPEAAYFKIDDAREREVVQVSAR